MLRWFALLLLASTAQAQRLRHEYIPPEILRLPVNSTAPGEAIEGDGPMPSAVKRDGERLEAPGEAKPDAPTFRPAEDPKAKEPDSIPRPREARPDRNTTEDAPLTYHIIFNPVVAPLRRNVAFDQVEADYRMTIAGGPLREAPRGPRTGTPGRELFWGDLKVATGRGPAPVPSVAPDMRILAVQAEPAVQLRFSKDSADNYYVESAHVGEVRLVFLVDADSAYFSAPLPGNVPLGAQAGHPGTELPPAIAEEGRGVLQELGISSDLPFDQGLNRLVAWFRDFEAAEPEAPKGSIYQDLALGQRGVCRHRAFAFVITARAAGVPTRAVQNEAHAFAEILAPDGHWRRIDLGGQAPSLDLKGGDDHRMHRPPPDPFAKPRKYLSQYSAAVAGGEPGGPGEPGGTGEPGAPKITGAPPPIGGGGGGGEPGPDPIAGGDVGEGPPAEVPLPTEPGQPYEIMDDPAVSADPPPPQLPVQLRLDLDSQLREAWRGEPLPFPVTGTLRTPEGAAVGGLRVQLYVVPENGGAPRPVGAAVTAGPDGRFQAPIQLPPTLPLGPWRLVAASAAGQGFAPARSDTE